MPESRININNLSPYQLAIQGAVGKGKGADKRLTAEMLGRIADSVFGAAPITPGSQITYQDATTVRWIDPEGFEHVATRDLNGTNPNAGRWNTQTNRPPVSPDRGAQQLSSTLTGGFNTLAQQTLSNLTAQARGERVPSLDPGISADLDAVRALAAQLQQPAALANLDPETRAALQQITDNTLAQLSQQFERDQASRVAELFGNRIQQSSIAGNVLGQLLQQQGLVRSQALSDAAMRELGTRQFLTESQRANQQLALQGLLGAAGTGIEGFRATTGASQNQLNSLSDLLQNLTGQQTQRDIATGGINVDMAKLAEVIRQANQNFELNQQNADLALAQARQQSDVFGNLLKGVGGSLVSLGLGKLPGLSEILGGGGGGGVPVPKGVGPILTPPLNPQFPTNPRLPGF